MDHSTQDSGGRYYVHQANSYVQASLTEYIPTHRATCTHALPRCVLLSTESMPPQSKNFMLTITKFHLREGYRANSNDSRHPNKRLTEVDEIETGRRKEKITTKERGTAKGYHISNCCPRHRVQVAKLVLVSSQLLSSVGAS